MLLPAYCDSDSSWFLSCIFIIKLLLQLSECCCHVDSSFSEQTFKEHVQCTIKVYYVYTDSGFALKYLLK